MDPSGNLVFCGCSFLRCFSKNNMFSMLALFYLIYFLSQISKCQLAETIVRLRVFLTLRLLCYFTKFGKHPTEIQNSRIVLFWKKRAPARNAPGLVRMGFYQIPQIPESLNPQITNISKLQFRSFAILDAKQ